MNTTLYTFNGSTPSPTVWTLSGMTLEQIKFREKCFIGTHWIISIMILSLVALVFGMNKYRQLQKDAQTLQNELEHQQNTKDTYNAGAVNKTPNTDSSIESPSAETSSRAVDGVDTSIQSPSADTSTNVDLRSKFGSISIKSSVSSRSCRARKKSYEEEQGERINKLFKTTAGICIFLWWTCVSAEACSMMIWHYNYLIAIEIAFPWDTSRMLIYRTSKWIMYLMYITRTYYSFNKSAYKYTKWFIIVLYTLICLDYIIQVIVYIVLNKITSGDIKHKESASDFLYSCFIFLVIEELMVVILIIFAFLKPLFKMSRFTIRDNILTVITRYLILGSFAILSSTVLSLYRILYVGSFDLMIVWLTAIWVSTDCLINTFCTLLLFRFAVPTYTLFCGCCDRRLRVCIKSIHQKRLQSKQNNQNLELGQ